MPSRSLLPIQSKLQPRQEPWISPPARPLSVEVKLPQALVSQYVQNCRGDLAQLKAALAAGEYETARRLGHQMKGTGKPYGFPGLTQIGRAIEWAASKPSGCRTR